MDAYFDFEDQISDRKYKDFLLKTFNPYGFWKISKASGATPAQLNGTYTSQMDAERAIDSYLNAVAALQMENTVEAKAQKLREKSSASKQA